ncbi:MAG: NADH-quinone oxidoreductase subunit C [Nocardioidaceae bacterium]
MAWADRVAEVFGELGDTTYDEGFGPLTATVPAEHWAQALTLARDSLGCTFFDWLSAVDELAAGFSVVCHLADTGASAAGMHPGVRRLLVRTTVPRETPTLPSAVEVFAGAAWHERETSEMFGITFTGAPAPPTRHLLLPEEFEGHPLRKDFVLASRVAKPWPGAKEPGESDEGGPPSRRRTRPPGVPEPEAWGPRAPDTPQPDPLAHAQPGQARPRRARPPREQSDG